MSRNGKNAFVIIATILYSCIWFCMLFIVVGFFMPTPVRFCKKINGSRTTTYKTKTSSKYGLSDDPELDEAMFYDTVIEDD